MSPNNSEKTTPYLKYSRDNHQENDAQHNNKTQTTDFTFNSVLLKLCEEGEEKS